MLALFLSALALRSCAPQAPNISFCCRAEPMRRLVEDLGKATGLKLAVSRTCANDVLLIQVANVPVQDLLAEIAKVDAGQWKPTDGGYVFAEDIVARRSETRMEIAHRAAKIRSDISQSLTEWKKQVDELKKAEAARASAKKDAGKPVGGDSDDDADEIQDAPLDQGDVLRVLQLIDPSALVLAPGTRAVFSTAPNDMQQPLPSEVSSILAEVIQRHNAAIPADATESADADKQLESDPQLPPSARQYLLNSAQLIKGFSKADLIIEPQSMFSGLTAHLVLFDNRGTECLSENGNLSDDTLLGSNMPDDANESEAAQAGTPIPLSDDTKLLVSLSKTQTSASHLESEIQAPKAVMELLSDPEHHDPLSFFVSDGLLALASSRHQQLVASLPDESIGIEWANNATMSLEKFILLPQVKTNLSQNTNGTWLEVKSANPESARRFRVDRLAFTKLLKSALSNGSVVLDTLSDYAINAPSPTTSMFTLGYMAMVGAIDAGSMFSGQSDWDLYRFYGELSPDQKQGLISGGKLPLNSLSLAEQNTLLDYVYGPSGHLTRGKQQAAQPNPFGDGIPIESDFISESTELLPKGISGGYLEVVTEDQPCFSPILTSFGPTMIMGPDEMARMAYFSQKDKASGQSSQRLLQKIRIGQRTSYQFTFHLGGDIRLVGKLNDDRIPKDATVVSIDNMPGDIHALLAKKMDAYKEFMEKAEGTGDTDATSPAQGGGPPPAP